ncbi:hypothetical protein, partial [Pseudomonas gessardii]|uniref:hypothetical protein n=1 Tax=Pseudomonas gessardii TaxID=78544 RepID=UPI001F2B69EA
MLAPVIFICPRLPSWRRRAWWMQTRTSGASNQYLFYKYFMWNIFSIKIFFATFPVDLRPLTYCQGRRARHLP